MSFTSIVGSTFVFLALLSLHVLFYMFTSHVIRPEIPNMMINSHSNQDIHSINKRLLNLDLPTINSPLAASSKSKQSLPSKHTRVYQGFSSTIFDIGISNSMHLILLSILQSLTTTQSPVFLFDIHLTIIILSLLVIQLVPIYLINIYLALPDSNHDRIITSICYSIGTCLVCYALVAGLMGVPEPTLTQLGVHSVDILGILVVAIVNLLICSKQVLKWYRWQSKRSLGEFQTKQEELLILLERQNEKVSGGTDFQLEQILDLLDQLEAYPQSNASNDGKISLITRVYWVYCFFRGLMWVRTLFSVLSISLQTLSAHKRDNTVREIIVGFLHWDHGLVDVVLGLVGLGLNLWVFAGVWGRIQNPGVKEVVGCIMVSGFTLLAVT